MILKVTKSKCLHFLQTVYFTEIYFILSIQMRVSLGKIVGNFPETWLVCSGDILTSWGEGASLALVDYSSSDGITIKMPYGVDVLHRPASHPIFSYWIG